MIKQENELKHILFTLLSKITSRVVSRLLSPAIPLFNVDDDKTTVYGIPRASFNTNCDSKDFFAILVLGSNVDSPVLCNPWHKNSANCLISSAVELSTKRNGKITL